MFSFLMWPKAVLAERINQEGRILGPLLSVTNATLFNTAGADSVVSSMQIYPITNPWNEDISRAPVLSNSAAMISQITNDLATNRQTLRLFYEMNYVLVPTNQPQLPIDFFNYPDESDPPPYPIPTNLPVETWPIASPTTNLVNWQKDVTNVGGDRHSIIVMPASNIIWETWETRLLTNGWEASNGAKFDLNGNSLRPAGWTSADAAGLPMFPALVRYDECERGMVEHAMRIVVKRTRKEYIYPATHWASTNPATQVNIPAMGQRLRLKASYVIATNWTKEEKAVALALKKYGALVADNGNFFSISVAPDDRWPANCFSHINALAITNFEVVQTTGPTSGPRTPNPPVAFTGVDFMAAINTPVQLNGYVAIHTNLPVTNTWKLYTGPTNVVFADIHQTNSSVTFGSPGVYTLLLAGDDGLHAIAYDAVVVTVGNAPTVSTLAVSNSNVVINWTGGSAPFVIERANNLALADWTPIKTNNSTSLTLPISGNAAFFRIRGQ